MQRYQNRFCAAAAFAAVAGFGIAQAPAVSPGSTPPSLPVNLGTLHGIAQADGRVVGFSMRYKAVFDHGGVEYTPALGERAPHNMPLRFTLQSVRRGEQTLLDATAAAPPEPCMAGDRVSYDRGDIDEHYDVRGDGVEQSFSFERPLAGSGDLIVRGRITTELRGERGTDGGWRWLLDGVGGVSYGRVTGVDAAGHVVTGDLRCEGAHVELALPAAFVDAAVYPLVLDPLLGTEFLVSGIGPIDNSDPDIAYDASNDVYLVTLQNRFSAVDTDVYAQRMNGVGGVFLGAPLLVDGSVSTASHVRVANVNASDQFLVVWAWAPGPFGPWDVLCRRVDAATGAMSTVVNVVATGNNETEPCVSGEATTADNEALVIWKDPAGIQGRQVTVTAAADPVSVAPSVLIGGGSGAQVPCISKSGGSAGRHIVAWYEGFIVDTEIHAICVDRNLNLLSSELITANSVNDVNPSVDGNGTSWLLVWQQYEPASSRGNIRMQRLVFQTPNLFFSGTETPLESDLGQDEATPDVCYLGQKYAVVYREEVVGSPLHDDVYLWIVEPSTLERCGVRHQLDGLNVGGADYENVPRCGARYAGSASSSSDEGFTVFAEALDAPPFSSVVIAQRFEAVGPGGPIVNLGGGCGLMGLHDTIGGGFAVGNPSFAFRATGVPAISLTFLSLAVPAPLVPCGPCVLVSPLVLSFVANPGTGIVTSTFAVPCDPIFVGFQVDSQWIAFGTTASPCPLFASLSASNALRSTLDF